MNINDLIDILLKIREKNGNLSVWIPDNYGNDDYKICTRAVQQEIYTHSKLLTKNGEPSVILKTAVEDIKE